MSNQEKPVKMSKLLRLKAQEFLSSKRFSDNLVDIMKHFSAGADLTSCLLSLELIFTNLLKERQMLIEVVPLKPIERSPEIQYREWLRSIYEECFSRVLNCCENSCAKIQTQGNTSKLLRSVSFVTLDSILRFIDRYESFELRGETSVGTKNCGRLLCASKQIERHFDETVVQQSE